MAKLSTKERNDLPESDFAVAGRKYPVEDESHAKNALARVSQHGSPEEKAEVREKVHRKFPAIGKKRSAGARKGVKSSEKHTARKRV